MAKPLFYGTITDLGNGVKSRFIDANSKEIIPHQKATNEETTANKETPANHIFIKNKTNQTLAVIFSNDNSQQYPLEANETLVFSPQDNFKFSDVAIKNDSGAQATGTVYGTIGWLY
jgi:hypothetical protein